MIGSCDLTGHSAQRVIHPSPLRSTSVVGVKGRAEDRENRVTDVLDEMDVSYVARYAV